MKQNKKSTKQNKTQNNKQANKKVTVVLTFFPSLSLSICLLFTRLQIVLVRDNVILHNFTAHSTVQF